mgnify:CR=1 FL=1
MANDSAEALHAELSARLERGAGRYSTLFQNWIKFEDNAERLHRARGAGGTTYLFNRLAAYEVGQALTALQTAQEFWDKDKFDSYLNAEDDDGNGVWHYLADNLRMTEGRDTLKMARMLIDLDVDFARRNKHGISPLGKMLVPTPKWQSINALIQTKHLQIANIEAAVMEQAKGDEKLQANMMCTLFASDLSENRALLSQHILKQAVQSNTDKEQRSATCRLFFDYIDPEDGTTPFHKLIGSANQAMFDDLLRLLLVQTEETVMGMAPPDVASKKVYRQAVLCRRLLRRDRAGQTVFFHCLRLEKLAYMRKLTGYLINDDLAIKKLVRGEPQPQPVVVDKHSPAPANPLLSALLARDKRGDTLLHMALRNGDKPALEALLYGLASNDVHAMLTRVPDGSGLTLTEMTDLDKVKARLIRAIKAGRLSKEAAEKRLKQIANIDKDVTRYVKEKVSEIEALANDTTGGVPVAPSFDLKKLAPA